MTDIETIGWSDSAGNNHLVLWAYVPGYLLLHGIVATCLPSRLDPLSTIFIVLAELLAVAACISPLRKADSEIRIFWFLLAFGIVVHSAAMSLDAFDEIIRVPLLNHVPAIQIFLSMTSGVPWLVAVSLQNDHRILRKARIIYATLSLAIGTLIYLQIFSFLTLYGTRHSSDEATVTLLFDAIDLFLAVAATLRWLGSGQIQERRFFRILTAFLWMNAVLPAVHNRILMRHDYVWLDLLISAPYVVLVSLVLTSHPRPVKVSSPAFNRAIRSGSPIFLASALVAVAFIMARSHFYIGLTAALFAIAIYGALNVIVQSRRIETEDSLMASNAILEKLVELDGLTGIANRRAFNERLEHEFAVSLRTRQPVSLLMIDVDRFKELNDNIGHVVADEYLTQIAAALSDTLPRVTDIVARYGGEEFAVILPATDAEGAMVAAERARQGVADLGLLHHTVPLGIVTVSVGVSTFDGWTTCSPTDLTDSADRALYRAKHNGRNRSEFRLMDISHLISTARS